MQETEILLQGNKLKLATVQAGNQIPENELLIFYGLLGEQDIRLKSDIYALVQNERLMISLNDFVVATDLAISVSPDKHIAAGWFIREDQDFLLDAVKREITIMGETGQVPQDDLYIEGETIYVASTQLEKWFGLEINIDLSNLALKVNTSQMLPLEEKALREMQPLYQSATRVAQLPLKEEPYRIISSKPYLDVSLNAGATKEASAEEVSKNMTWNAVAGGDFLGFSSHTAMSGILYNTEAEAKPISGIRQTFSREDPNGEMLGPLNATQLAFGDISSTPLSIGGGGTSGLGARVSNRSLGGMTSLNTIDIEGNALPGWEVELFRDEASLGLVTVTEDSRYVFPSVFLFAGNNVLRLVFYGPQGEIREETREIFAGANVGLTGGQWDLSVVRADTQLYELSPKTSAIQGDMHLSAIYEYSLGEFGSGRAGLASYTAANSLTATRKNILQSGFSTRILDTLIAGDSGYDIDGAYAGTLSLRQNFGRHQTGILHNYSSQGFASVGDTETAERNRTQVFISGPVSNSLGMIINPKYSLNANRYVVTNGLESLSVGGALSGRVGAYSFSTGLRYLSSNGPSFSTSTESVLGTTSAGGVFGKGRWRLTSSYLVKPDFDLLAFTGQYRYPITRDLDGQAEIEHRLEDGLTQLDLSANWLTEKFTVTPRLSVDTENNMIFSANMRFSLAPNPYTGEYSMYAQNLAQQGGVGARVFVDVNGDGLYNEGEELLEETQIRALQSNRQAYTDKNGTAFIPDLNKSQRTDITLVTNSLPDVYYLSLEDGYSVLPRPGVTSKIDFPVVVAGEVDGFIRYKTDAGNNRTARNLRINLISPDGTIQAKSLSAQDGSYLLTSIKPGVYYLTAETTSSHSPGYTLPLLLEFKADGSTFFGQDIALTSGYRIPFRFSSTNAPPGSRKTRVVRPIDIASQTAMLHVGEYRSNIMLTLAWYKLQLKTKGLFKYFTLATPIADIQPDAAGMLSIPLQARHKLSAEGATRACKMLQDIDLPCAVEIITTYHETVPSAKIPEKTAPSGETG